MKAVCLAACALLALGSVTCSRDGTARSAVAQPPPGDFVLSDDARGVATAAVKAVPLPDYLDVSGHIQADPTRVVRVYPPVSGRWISIAVHPSDAVQEGQVLATLASSDVAAARAAFRQAEADARVKEAAIERSRILYENNVIALREYQQAQADAQSAGAARASALERLQLLNADTAGSSDEVAITAPRAGVVTDVAAAPGEFAKSLDNSAPLCTIVDLTRVWAMGDVYEKDLATVRPGATAEVTVTAYPGEIWRAPIAAVSSTVDTVTRTLKVRVELGNAGLRLKPDMFATIRVVRAVRTTIVVRETAVVRDGPSAYVFVRTSPGHFARRQIALGRDTEDHWLEVAAGLTAGDTVVVEGVELLRAVAATP